jgi:superfamily I DNA and RNA helicase
MTHKSSDDELEQLEMQLVKLGNDGIPAPDITILSPVDYHESCVSRSKVGITRSADVVSPSSMKEWPDRKLTFSTIAHFKGLENKFILLVDLDRVVDMTRQGNLLYVAMSRAQIQLWLTLSRRANAAFTKLMKSNLKAVTRSLSSDQTG